MSFVIMFWFVMIGIVIAQLGAILYHMKYGEKITIYGAYTTEVKENTKIVMRAIKSRIIKKHLLTNSAEKYDSGKTLEQYRKFLQSDLMNDMMQMHEEQYYG